MATVYSPTVAKAEFAGHTFDEIRFAKNLENSVRGFAQILKGEKKGHNARNFIDKMIKEAAELKNESK
jgi:hypothetical protein